jgi:hypothetical protein
MYKIKDNKDKKEAEQLADKFDYNALNGKIPIGIIYQSEERSLEEKWPQLKKQLNKKTNTLRKPSILDRLIPTK